MRKILYGFIIIFFTSCGGGGADISNSSSYNPSVIVYSSANSLSNDNFSRYQWYIDDKGLYVNRFGTQTDGNTDLGIDNVWEEGYIGYNNGTPIVVQVVDDGVDANHEDLKENVNLTGSYNSDPDATNTNDPSPEDPSNDNHGTQVAGIIGAVGYNNIGIKGIAPSSNIVGYTFNTNGSGSFTNITYANLYNAWYVYAGNANVAVSNNSWGSCINNSDSEEDILRMGSEDLRSGKGVIYVFSSGNSRNGSGCPSSTTTGSSNTSYLRNSQYSIAVGAVNSNDEYASYSSPGSNVLVSAYSGDSSYAYITTTVPTGTAEELETIQEDTKRNYTFSFSGTSASAPMVSGSIALVLEACPNLTYRDVKYLAAFTANRPGGSTTWTRNAAGFYHSNDFGFGLINPYGMISVCTNPLYSQLSSRKTTTISSSTTLSIPANTKLNVTDDLTIEWIGLKVATDYNIPDTLEITLTSPSGTVSTLLDSGNQFGYPESSILSAGFRFSSVAFLDESSLGDWEINITSTNSYGAGDVTSLELEIVGH